MTDEDTKFRGEFQEMLDEAFNDHRRTSRDHPQADSLAERMVQTLKVALRKACLTGKVSGWEDRLATITIGYSMSTHESMAHFIPYYLLFGRQPLLGRSVSNTLRELPELDLDDRAAWVASVTARIEAFKPELPMAMRNLAVAAAREMLRDAYT